MSVSLGAGIAELSRFPLIKLRLRVLPDFAPCAAS